MVASTYTFQTPQIVECHKHDKAQMMVGIDGITKIDIEGSNVILDQKTGCIIPSRTEHTFIGEQDNLNLVINFDINHSNDTVKRLFDNPKTFALDQSLKKFLSFSALELPHFQGCVDIGNNLFCQQIISVFTKLLNDRLTQSGDHYQRIDLQKIEQFVIARLHQKITVEEMARAAKMCSSHFFKFFRQDIGITPYQFVIEKRLEKAMVLLKTTNLTIADISFQTGFSSQSALNNAFKKEFKMTPGSVSRS